MKLGVTMFATDQSIGPVDLARAVETRGFYSLYIPEHTHIPTSRRTPPPTGDKELPEEYKRSLDPFVALAAAAGVTSRIKLGTGICLVAQRDPIVTAKEVATLDLISNGRFVFGIGFGWNQDEMESHGVDFPRRRERVREHVLAMQRLWTNEKASFEGEFVRFEESWSWPKPLQQPRPPILIGGAAGPKLFKHIAEYADGWIPIGGAGVRAALSDLQRAMREAGRDPADLRVVPFGTIPDAGKLEYYHSLGITEVVLRIPSVPADTVLRLLDEYAKLL
ncbi:MAG TPA: LLM class F420-dependent oxidoreductase [Candidatus Binatia bacterium]